MAITMSDHLARLERKRGSHAHEEGNCMKIGRAREWKEHVIRELEEDSGEKEARGTKERPIEKGENSQPP